MHPAYLWRWDGSLDRLPYFLTGAILLALKHGLDWLTATFVFGRSWSPFDYFVLPAPVIRIPSLPEADQLFYGTLLVLALPCICAGVVLTVQRLRAVGLPPALCVFFFVPVANLFFFLILAVLPTRTGPAPVSGDIHGVQRWGGSGPENTEYQQLLAHY